MPTYLELAQEPVWLAQVTPASMTAVLLDPLRAFYNMGPSAIGAAGDNNHLYGRHRSRNWDLISRYCTDRSYATQDARDKAGAGDWYRACDVGIQGQTLWDASHRIDALVRSGGAPGVAEWFGTFDGVNVVGWYEGHPSSSDDSHLYHLHVGVWTQYADDAATMRLLYETVTGETMAYFDDPDAKAEGYRIHAMSNDLAMVAGSAVAGEENKLHTRLNAIDAKLNAIIASLGGGGGGGGGLTEAQVAAVVRAELNKTRLTD